VNDDALRWYRTMVFGRSPGFAPGPAPVGPWRPVALRTVTADGNSIHVTVQITQPTKILSIIHIDHFTVTGTATARLAAGVTGLGR